MASTDEEDGNVTDIIDSEDDAGKFNGLKILQLVIASMGIITNIIVVIVFLNDRKLRRKIPNICIINQVGVFIFYICLTSLTRAKWSFPLNFRTMRKLPDLYSVHYA